MHEFHFSPIDSTPIVGAVIVGPCGTRKVRLVFDTGAAVTQVHIPTMAKVGYSPTRKVADAAAIGGGGKEDQGYVVRVDKFAVLGAKMTDVPIAAFHMQYLDDDGIDGLLGWDMIRQFHLEMKGPEGVLIIF
jgi:hypothetical protein